MVPKHSFLSLSSLKGPASLNFKTQKRVGSKKPYSDFSSVKPSNDVGIVSLIVSTRPSLSCLRGGGWRVGSPLIATQVTKANEAKSPAHISLWNWQAC